jgi:hypothetical protein
VRCETSVEPLGETWSKSRGPSPSSSCRPGRAMGAASESRPWLALHVEQAQVRSGRPHVRRRRRDVGWHDALSAGGGCVARTARRPRGAGKRDERRERVGSSAGSVRRHRPTRVLACSGFPNRRPRWLDVFDAPTCAAPGVRNVPSGRTGRRPRTGTPRSCGPCALGLVIAGLGLWAALAPFVGPYFLRLRSRTRPGT